MGELLGVAGTDVPIAEIVKLVPPHSVRIKCSSPRYLVLTFRLGSAATALQ